MAIAAKVAQLLASADALPGADAAAAEEEEAAVPLRERLRQAWDGQALSPLPSFPPPN